MEPFIPVWKAHGENTHSTQCLYPRIPWMKEPGTLWMDLGTRILWQKSVQPFHQTLPSVYESSDNPPKLLFFPGFLTFTFYRTSSLILPWLSVDIMMTWYLRCFAKYDSIHAHPDVPAHYSGIYIPPTLPLVLDAFLHLNV